MVYLCECDYDIGHVIDPIHKQVISNSFSDKWLEVMEDEIRSIAHNNVWVLLESSKGVKPTSYKWVFKTKNDSKVMLTS